MVLFLPGDTAAEKRNKSNQLTENENDKGYHDDLATLAAAIVTGETGWYAILEDTETYATWNGSAWVDSGVNIAGAAGAAGADGADGADGAGSGTYTEHTASASLVTGTANYFKSGASPMTLPLLSTTTDGDQVSGLIAGSDHTVIVNHHASDSAGAEHWTGYAKGDHFLFTVVDGAWHVDREKTTVRGWLAKTADQTISADGQSIHAANYSVEEDIGDWFDSGTNHRLNVGFDCVIDFRASVVAENRDVGVAIAIDGATQADIGLSKPQDTAQGTGFFLGKISSGSYMEAWGYQDANADILGDAAKDETRVYWNLTSRVR